MEIFYLYTDIYNKTITIAKLKEDSKKKYKKKK